MYCVNGLSSDLSVYTHAHIKVRSVMGPQAYLLKANEELYQKTLMPLMEDILKYVIVTILALK